MIGLVVLTIIVVVPTALGVWLAERVDRPRRAAMREERARSAKQGVCP